MMGHSTGWPTSAQNHSEAFQSHMKAIVSLFLHSQLDSWVVARGTNYGQTMHRVSSDSIDSRDYHGRGKYEFGGEFEFAS